MLKGQEGWNPSICHNNSEGDELDGVRGLNRMRERLVACAHSKYSEWGLALVAFAESSFFPLPPDLLLIPMCVGARQRALRYATLCTLFSVLGGLFGYCLGALGWEALGPMFYQYVPGFSEARFGQVQSLYLEWGLWIVFTAGFSPIPYKLFTLASGVMGLPLLPFALASLLGRGMRFFLLGFCIKRYGERVEGYLERHGKLLAVLMLVLVVLGFAVLKWVMP